MACCLSNTLSVWDLFNMSTCVCIVWIRLFFYIIMLAVWYCLYVCCYTLYVFIVFIFTEYTRNIYLHINVDIGMNMCMHIRRVIHENTCVLSNALHHTCVYIYTHVYIYIHIYYHHRVSKCFLAHTSVLTTPPNTHQRNPTIPPHTSNIPPKTKLHVPSHIRLKIPSNHIHTQFTSSLFQFMFRVIQTYQKTI